MTAIGPVPRWVCDADPARVEHTNFAGWTPCPECRVIDAPGDLIGRSPAWWQGYAAGCDATHAAVCATTEAERDALRAQLATTERLCEQRIADLQAEYGRQIRALERQRDNARADAAALARDAGAVTR